MTKKHYIALANMIREQNSKKGKSSFNMEHIETLALFCASYNDGFSKERFINYILTGKLS